jgi:hypothetical protein
VSTGSKTRWAGCQQLPHSFLCANICKVGTKRLACRLGVTRQCLRQLCRFLDSPLRTVHAAFTAHGAPRLVTPRRESPSGSYPSGFGLHRLNFIKLRPSALQDDLPLVPFAMWTALPPSNYYETSDATHVSLPDCWEHLFQGSLPRSCCWTL